MSDGAKLGSELPEATAVDAADYLFLIQSGTTKKVLASLVGLGTGNIAEATIVGRAVGAGTGAPVALTQTQLRTIIDVFSTTARGLVPQSSVSNHTQVLWDDGWGSPTTGAGDMLAATYDPTSVAGDAFDMDNMVEGATNLILTADERAAIAGIATAISISGTPNANDIARWTDATTVEGIDYDTLTTALALVLADISDAGALAALETVGSGEIDTSAVVSTKIAAGAVIGEKISTGEVQAPAHSGGLSTVSSSELTADVDLIRVSAGTAGAGCTDVQINTPAAARNVWLWNELTTTINVQDDASPTPNAISTTVLAGTMLWLNYNGGSWVEKARFLTPGSVVAGITEATNRTFSGTIAPDTSAVNYSDFAQSGAASFTKGSGSFDGSTHHLPFTSNGSAITWNAGFRSASGAALPTSLTAGLWDIFFFYNEDRDDILVTFAAIEQSTVVAALEGATLSGSVNFADNELIRPLLKDVAEQAPTTTSSSGTLTLNCETANVFQVTLSENVTSFVLSNPPATAKLGCITLILIQDSTPRTVDMSSILWPGGSAPTLSTGAGAIDIFTFITRDAGSTWYGFTGGQDFS